VDPRNITTRRCQLCAVPYDAVRGSKRKFCEACRRVRQQTCGAVLRAEYSMSASEVDAYLRAAVQREVAMSWQRRAQ